MRQSIIKVAVHGVWATRSRIPVLRQDGDRSLRAAIIEQLLRLRCAPLAFGASDDHVHVLFWLDSQASLAQIFRAMKSASSRTVATSIRQQFHWQDGYAAFAVERDAIPAVARYVTRQRIHHAERSALAELEMPVSTPFEEALVREPTSGADWVITDSIG